MLPDLIKKSCEVRHILTSMGMREVEGNSSSFIFYFSENNNNVVYGFKVNVNTGKLSPIYLAANFFDIDIDFDTFLQNADSEDVTNFLFHINDLT